MSLVRFKDLCLDAEDPPTIGRWWADRLGLTLNSAPPSEVDQVLQGPAAGHTIWINRVDEPKSVKNRVHIDIRSASLEPFAGLTEVPVGPQDPWLTYLDPEGNEFCVFTYAEVPAQRLKAIEVDSVNARSISAWWHAMLGGDLVHEQLWSSIVDVPGLPCEGFDFGAVPEPKTVKNRIHWDVTLHPGVSVADLIEHGATALREPDDDIAWTVMADPEGNEFCVFDT